MWRWGLARTRPTASRRRARFNAQGLPEWRETRPCCEGAQEAPGRYGSRIDLSNISNAADLGAAREQHLFVSTNLANVNHTCAKSRFGGPFRGRTSTFPI